MYKKHTDKLCFFFIHILSNVFNTFWYLYLPVQFTAIIATALYCLIYIILHSVIVINNQTNKIFISVTNIRISLLNAAAEQPW
jgi:hypothetical protein